MAHNQKQIEARLTKLTKEEERAQKRIRDAERKANFIAEMHMLKEEKLAQKQQWKDDLKANELFNRSRINQHRTTNKATIKEQRGNCMKQNWQHRQDIKEQQEKIRDTIHQFRSTSMRDKQSKASEIYHMYQHAKFNRNVAQNYYNQSTADKYQNRIGMTNYDAESINQYTQKLEKQEAQMLQKLQNTYGQEKQVIKKLNDLQRNSPVNRQQREDKQQRVDTLSSKRHATPSSQR